MKRKKNDYDIEHEIAKMRQIQAAASESTSKSRNRVSQLEVHTALIMTAHKQGMTLKTLQIALANLDCKVALSTIWRFIDAKKDKYSAS